MPASLAVRVTVLDTWEDATLHLSPATLIADLKRTALRLARVRRPPVDYMVKYRGAELEEAGRTLADAGIPQNGALIVMTRRRTPVR